MLQHRHCSTTFCCLKCKYSKIMPQISSKPFLSHSFPFTKPKYTVEAFPISSNARVTGYWVFRICCSWQYYNWYTYPNFNMSRVDLDMRPLAFEYFGLMDGTSHVHLDHGVSMIQLLRSTLWNWILNNKVGFRRRTRYWCATLKTWEQTWMYSMACPFLPSRGKPSSPQSIRYSIWVAFLVTLKCSFSSSKVQSTLPESTAHEHVTLGF